MAIFWVPVVMGGLDLAACETSVTSRHAPARRPPRCSQIYVIMLQTLLGCQVALLLHVRGAYCLALVVGVIR